MKITIEINNDTYIFHRGYEAFIFDGAIENEMDKLLTKQELIAFVHLVAECYLKDCNTTPLGALVDFVAANWTKIKSLSYKDILFKFYLQI